MRAACILLCLLAACSGGGAPAPGSGSSAGSGSLTLELTDKPLDHALVLEAVVAVDRVRIHRSEGADGEDGGWRELDLADDPLVFDLVELRAGLTRLLVDGVDLPAGEYRQLRLRVASARLLLIDGDLFTTADGSLQLTSQGTSGFKVKIDPPLTVIDGGLSRFLLDVDLTKTFKPVPGDDPLNANKYHLHPVIRVINRLASGEVHGRVVDAGGSGLESATVYALPPGSSDADDALASTGSGPHGRFALLGLLPGTYDLLATWNTLDGLVTGVQVIPGHAVEVEIVVD